MDTRDRIFNMDDHSPAQTVVKACTFIASLVLCCEQSNHRASGIIRTLNNSWLGMKESMCFETQS